MQERLPFAYRTSRVVGLAFIIESLPLGDDDCRGEITSNAMHTSGGVHSLSSASKAAGGALGNYLDARTKARAAKQGELIASGYNAMNAFSVTFQWSSSYLCMLRNRH